MKSFVRDDQTVGTYTAVSLHGGVRFGWLAWSAAACLALLVGTAAAQQEPAHKMKRIEAGSTPKRQAASKDVEAQPAPTAKATPKAATGKSGCGSHGAGKAGVDLTPVAGGPQPLWVCGDPVCTIDPIWSGEQIACAFSIRNGGQADLNIKAKGG